MASAARSTSADIPEQQRGQPGVCSRPAVEAGIPYRRTSTRATRKACTWFQMTAQAGKRHSTAVGYLHPVMNRPNLRVETEALTTRILFEGKRAVGVEFEQGGEKPRSHGQCAR